MRPTYQNDVLHCPNCKSTFGITIHGNWVCHCNVWVKTNEHDDERETHPLYKLPRYNVGARSYVIVPEKK